MGNIAPLASTILVPRKASPTSHRNIRVAYFLAALAAFLGGVAIYTFFRNIDNMVLFRHIPQLSFLATPHIQLATDTIWGHLFVFNLLHGLWCLSALLVIRAVWLTDTKWRAIYGGIFIAIASILEIAQLNENIPGTFDRLDLAAYGIAAFLESIMYKTFTHRRIV